MNKEKGQEDQGGRFAECVEKMCENKIYTKSEVLQQFGGYCLMDDCRYQQALILYGPGATGKSTVLAGFEAVIGRDNISYLNMADLGKRFSLAELQHKRLNIMRNMDTTSKDNFAIFKRLLSGELITAERKYEKPFQFRPIAKFIIELNDIPRWPKQIGDALIGLRQRLIVLKFERQFSQHEADPTLPEKFVEEAPGILNWMIAGQKELLANGSFILPAAVKHDTQTFIESLIDKSLEGAE